jgi:hypothetical protein
MSRGPALRTHLRYDRSSEAAWNAGVLYYDMAPWYGLQTKIPAEFWADLKAQNLIEQNAPVPQLVPAGLS